MVRRRWRARSAQGDDRELHAPSATMPSMRRMVRGARATIAGSWVAKRNVVPAPRSCAPEGPRSRPRCASPGSRWARRPRMASGSWTSARARETRCRSPPESWSGRCRMRSARPTAASAVLGPPLAVRARDPVDPQRVLDVLERGEHGQQVEGLEHEAELAPPQLRLLGRGQGSEVRPSEHDLALVRLVQAAPAG